jgi:hypothetical protein
MDTLSLKSTKPFAWPTNLNLNYLSSSPPHALITLPYIQGTTNLISKLLAKKNIKTIFKPFKTLKQLFRTAKDKSDPMLGPRIYQIPCSLWKILHRSNW